MTTATNPRRVSSLDMERRTNKSSQFGCDNSVKCAILACLSRYRRYAAIDSRRHRPSRQGHNMAYLSTSHLRANSPMFANYSSRMARLRQYFCRPPQKWTTIHPAWRRSGGKTKNPLAQRQSFCYSPTLKETSESFHITAKCYKTSHRPRALRLSSCLCWVLGVVNDGSRNLNCTVSRRPPQAWSRRQQWGRRREWWPSSSPGRPLLNAFGRCPPPSERRRRYTTVSCIRRDSLLALSRGRRNSLNS